jgi:hypothetical protein
MLQNKKVRHEVGQDVESDQLSKMRLLEAEYSELRDKVDALGKLLNVISCFLSHPFLPFV